MVNIVKNVNEVIKLFNSYEIKNLIITVININLKKSSIKESIIP